MRLLLSSFVLLLAALSGGAVNAGQSVWDEGCQCFVPDTSGPQTDTPDTVSFTISGKVEFEAAFAPPGRGHGQVPDGHSPLPYLYLCAWGKKGDIDFKSTEFPTFDGDDLPLGCARADVNGNFALPVLARGASFDVYLSTALCDNMYQGARSPADVCVRINFPEGSEDRAKNIKAIWSRTYPAVKRKDLTISWNLSCPDKDGMNRPTVSCSSAEQEPDAWDQGCPCSGYPSLGADTCPKKCAGGKCGDTNSRYGCNKEAVHAYRAAIEAYKTWGTSKPSASSTFAKICPDSNGRTFCNADSCQDEVKFHLSRIQPDLNQDFDGPRKLDKQTGVLKFACDPTASNNGAASYDQICINTPWNPFRVAHELGHVIHMRWICSEKGQQAADPQRWDSREGFANFTSVAAWFDADANDPAYCGSEGECYDAEDAGKLSPDRADIGEARMTQFYWDLRDTKNANGSEPDSERWTYQEIRNIWSAFPNGSADTQSDEENGLNAWDFTYHWNEKHGLTTSYCALLKHNKVDQQDRCSACAKLCAEK